MNKFNRSYNTIYMGWNKMISTLYSVEDNIQFHNCQGLVNNFSELCDKNLKSMRNRIYSNPFKFRRNYKEYKTIKKLINLMEIEFMEILKAFQTAQSEPPAEPTRVVIKGFKRYDE